MDYIFGTQKWRIANGLSRKRQEVADPPESLQKQVHAPLAAITAADATLKLFGTAPSDAQVRHLSRRRRPYARNDHARIVITIVREGIRISHRAITTMVMARRGLNVADQALFETIREGSGQAAQCVPDRG